MRIIEIKVNAIKMQPCCSHNKSMGASTYLNFNTFLELSAMPVTKMLENGSSEGKVDWFIYYFSAVGI